MQELLGHFNFKTTMKYLHVRKEQLVNIISPLNDLWRKGGIKWQSTDNLNFRKDGLSARQLAFQNRKALIISSEKYL